MTQTRADRSADLTNGPMLQKIILFSIPLAASSILQLLFNAADVVVVGRFAGSTALAAVGSNGSLINLLVNLFVGLSLGANVVAARCFGAKDEHGIQDTVHTAVTLGLTSGVLLAVVGFFAARSLLELMSCPEDVIDLSSLYLKIYFIGMPMNMLYNFSSALLRAVGDTKRPLYCLAAAGIINVVLNLVFVIGFSMSVAGVALATIISETVSACLVTAMLVREKGALHLDLHKLGFHAGALKQILLIGLPAGLQSTVFSLSNVVIQSAINSFGSTVVAGSSASSNLEGFVYTAMNAFAQAAVTFTSQNMGARKYHNLDRVMRNCLLCAVVTGILLGGGAASSAASGSAAASSEALSADVQAIVDRGVLKVGVKNAVKGFSFQDTLTGEYTGLEDSLAEMIAEHLGVDVEFTTVTAATRGELLDSGDIDCVLATFTITDERRKSWDFSTPYYTDYVSVLVEDASGIKELADLKDKVVGVSSGSTSARALVQAMIDASVISGDGFDADTFNADTWKDGISFRQYDDYPAISTALSAGEVNGFCVDKSILAIYKTDGRSYIDAEFSPQEYGIATKKGSGFSALCDELVTGWLADGTIDGLIKDNGLD